MFVSDRAGAAGRGDDPARRPRRLLRVGRAARQPSAARAARHRRRRGGAVFELRGAGRAASAPRWAGRRRASCARGRSWCTPRMSAYSEASAAVFEVFDDTTPLVEGLSIDEAFLDVGGLRRVSGTPTEIAVRLRSERARARSVCRSRSGVARTKFLAKVASGVAKPDGLLVVPPDGELDFLHPLPVRTALGRRARDRATSCTSAASPPWARSPDSPSVARLDARSSVRPPPPCARPQPRPPTGGGRSPTAFDRLAARARSQPPLGRRHRRGRRRARRPRHRPDAGALARVGRTVTLRLRFDDFARATRSHTMPQATAQTHPILDAVRGLLATATPMIEAQGLTLIGVAVGNLADDDAVQLALPFDRHRDRRTRHRARRRAGPVRRRPRSPGRS